MKRVKKHFIFLGRSGLIYYSWLFILLFLAFIIGYESNQKISFDALLIGTLFIIGVIYTFFFSYIRSSKNRFEICLPYRGKQILIQQPQLCLQWHFLAFYRVKLSSHQQFCYMTFNRKRLSK